MQEVKITRNYPECGHSYAWSAEALSDPDQHTDECPICRVNLVDPHDDFVVGE